MIGKFKFTGESKSKWLKTKEVYTVDVKTAMSAKGEFVSVNYAPRLMGGQEIVKCSYQNWTAFFKNWQPML